MKARSFFTVMIVAIATVLFCIVGFSAQSYGLDANKPHPRAFHDRAPSLPYVPGEVLVRFKPDTDARRQSELKAISGIEGVLERIGPKSREDLQLLRLEPGTSVEQTVKSLNAKRPSVEIESVAVNNVQLNGGPCSFLRSLPQIIHSFVLALERFEDQQQPRHRKDIPDSIANVSENQVSSGVLDARVSANEHADAKTVGPGRVAKVDDYFVLTFLEQ